MKKLVCLAFVLALCLMAASVLAESTPSRTTGDLTEFEIALENQPMTADMFFRPVDESEVETQAVRLNDCRIEMEKLAASASPEAYFGDVLDMTDGGNGRLVTMSELIGTNTPNVFEFCPIIAGGIPENSGNVTVTMLFPTPFEEGQRVIVMIGFVTLNADGTQHAEWRAFEGIGLGKGTMAADNADGSQAVFNDTGLGADAVAMENAGRVKVVLDPQTMQGIQNGVALLSVVSE